MPEVHPIIQLLRSDPRFKIEAYQFVRDALAFAHETLKPGLSANVSPAAESDRHLTGQQLCEAARQYALDQYGFLAKTVLNSWGLSCTGDFGEVVYNLINVGLMKKSPHDRREDFDNVYEFDVVFREKYQITALPEA